MTRRPQALVGVGFAVGVIAIWLGLHVWAVFFHRWGPWDLILVPTLVAVQTWLATAMFIVAHDAIHGSLAPRRPRLNQVLGQVAVGLYAGFSFRKLADAHREHHAYPGTAADPDFHAAAPSHFLPWLRAFFLRHFGGWEFARVTLVLTAYLFLGAQPANLLVFWALPQALSALQLFWFGTYRPHRHETGDFIDAHRARSLDQSAIVALLTCLNFGAYHHQHHLSPELPWWRLPQGGPKGATRDPAAKDVA